MVKKKREYGELPKIASGATAFRCEVCARESASLHGLGCANVPGYVKDDLLKTVQGVFVQCPECGRWICSNCWDEDKTLCKLCARKISSNAASEIREELKGINNRISAIEEFMGSLKKCQDCGAMIIDPKAKFCGICGSDNLISCSSSLLSEILRSL